MTTIYFVRHAQPNYQNHDDLTRELTEKGLRDREVVTAYLADKQIDAVLSSPFKRAVDTVLPVAEARGLTVRTIEDFRERKIESVWIDNFEEFCRNQWADFSYKLSDGECLQEVQDRNMKALGAVLEEYRGQTLVIGTHGTALSTILHWFDPTFGYAGFSRIRHRMPWVVKMVFSGKDLVEMELTNVFKLP